MKIAVGSKNPVKINATRQAFKKVFPDKSLRVESVDAKSGVSIQPMSDEECIRGAENRARLALKLTGADFGVGIEGGLNRLGEIWFDCGWIVVLDKKGKIGIGSSIKMRTPDKMVAMVIKKKVELGVVNDILFKRKNSKQAEGHFGLMTKGAITRTHGYRDGVISALTRFINDDKFYK